MATKKAPKRWSLDEKAKILSELASASAAATADKYKISTPTIYAWKAAAGMNGGGQSPCQERQGQGKRQSEGQARQSERPRRHITRPALGRGPRWPARPADDRARLGHGHAGRVPHRVWGRA